MKTTETLEEETALLRAERDTLQVELAAMRLQKPKPIGYIRKTDLTRLQDEVMWDGSYLSIGVDHWAQWTEDTPYDHLAPIYATPAAAEVVQVLADAVEVIDMFMPNAGKCFGLDLWKINDTRIRASALLATNQEQGR